MKKQVVTLVFGDSIAYGLGDGRYGGFVNRLKKRMDKRKYGNFVYNLGIPGQTSKDIFQRVEEEITSRYNGYDNLILIFSVGIKDAIALNAEREYINNFNDTIDGIIHIAKKYTPNVYFLGILPVDYDIRTEYNSESVFEIDGNIRRICNDNRVNYLKMKEVIELKDLTDGLHPNTKGHQKIENYIYEEIYKGRKYENNKRNQNRRICSYY